MQKITADVFPVYATSESDAKLFIEWIREVRNQVSFDMDTLGYPRSCMTRAKMGEETVAMIPLQPVLMFESLVHKPGLTDHQTAMSLWQIGQVVEKAMVDTMHREAYFITNSEPEADSCEKHGWTKVMYDADKKIWLMKRKTAEAQKVSMPESVQESDKCESR